MQEQIVMDGGNNQLSKLLIVLLKGVLYQEQDALLWADLQRMVAAVRDYIAVLGLELVLDEAEGYAFLRSRVAEDDDDAKLARLIARRPLSFPVSLLLALLRKKLAESDAGGGETRLILSRDQIVELIRVFLPVGSHDTKLIDQVETHLKRIAELDFVRILPRAQPDQAQMYEVRRILKAFIDAQWLAEFDARLAVYRQQLEGHADE
ncbi:DUF4194 domain-containing protein [Deefgea salmonis]|uniref:DUF4194 domain-containing protein n=1 Tax=Deefgea salmonis TaxID=2875502 RepID=A0ABS8BHS2_9NEIS|nr:DUF4194 domain-containing protein [Deefgea salmonis]MCB5195258.1 DUF4194 domain-containing protein [Deefgea salmonis]